jgi:hypothetical protein
MPMNEPVNIIDPVKRLGLDADPNDRANVVRALKERVKELHPDRTGGKFESEEAKCAFLEAQTTLATVEAAETMALMPLREITSLGEGLAKSVVPLGVLQEEILRMQRTREIRERARAHHYSFKITSGTLLAISSGIFAFMGALKDNPLLGRLPGFPGIDVVLFLSGSTAGSYLEYHGFVNEPPSRMRSSSQQTRASLKRLNAFDVPVSRNCQRVHGALLDIILSK